MRASEQQRDDVRLERWLFERLRPALAASRLVFVDESGVNRALSRLYAWAQRGQRAYGHAPVNRGPNVTLIAAISLAGLVAPMQVEAATASLDGDVFLAYLDQVLCPRLKPGQVVLIDNLPAHKLKSVRARIESVGAELLYLPRYSPQYNPVEQLWSKLKTLLRSAAARTTETLDAAITAAFEAVTREDIQGWFRHCGYRT